PACLATTSATHLRRREDCDQPRYPRHFFIQISAGNFALVIKRASNRLKTGLIVGRLLPAYLLLGLLKHLVPLRWLARWAWCHPRGLHHREAERCLTASVLRLSQLTGLPDRDCLQRSLLLYRVLSRAGAEPTLVVGFDRIDGRILGHAWVTTDGHAVIEREADLLRFSPTFSFGTRGALLFQPTLNTPPAKPSNFHQ